MKPCPYCAERVELSATQCRYCGSLLAAAPAGAGAAAAPALAAAPPSAGYAPPPGFAHAPPSSAGYASPPVADAAPQLERWSYLGIGALTLLTCGFGALYLGWIQNSAIKRLNPSALDAAVVLILNIVGFIFTGGILNLFVMYKQAKALTEYGATRGHPQHNTGLMMVAMAGSVVSLLSLWFSWTGFAAFLAFAFHVYVLRTFHRELELYTRP